MFGALAPLAGSGMEKWRWSMANPLITNKEYIYFHQLENTYLKFFQKSLSQTANCSKYLMELRILWWTAAALFGPSQILLLRQ